jgi:hypothetical protein
VLICFTIEEGCPKFANVILSVIFRAKKCVTNPKGKWASWMIRTQKERNSHNALVFDCENGCGWLAGGRREDYFA